MNRPRRIAVWASLAFTVSASMPDATLAAPPSGTEMVDTFRGLFGAQDTHRAIHAKGIVAEGTFVPDRGAAALTKASTFRGGGEHATVRFSNFAGLPAIADTDGLATPRGMAVKISGPDGEMDIVSHSYDGFPARTAAEFRELLTALAHSGPGATSPTEAERFLATHPAAKTFLEHGTPPPVSFATLPYFGVNAFRFTDAAGKSRGGRYQLVPAAGEHFLSAEQIRSAGPDYLERELEQRLASGPIEFTLRVQLAAAGDRLDDPSIAWPTTRPTVTLGRLRITRIVSDSAASERALLFSPTNVPDGIAPADPMILVRAESYGVSYARRHP